MRKEETRGKFRLNGKIDDPERRDLIESTIETMARELATEKLNGDSEMRGNTHNCTRKKNEGTEAFTNRIDGAVAQ